MTKRLFNLTARLLVILTIAISPIAYASDFSDNTKTNFKDEREKLGETIKEKIEAIKTEIKSQREDSKKEMEDARESVKSEIKSLRDTDGAREEIQAKLESIREANKSKRDEFKSELEGKRELLKEEIKSQIANFKEGKKVVLDATKKENVAERIGNVFEKLSATIERIAGFDKRINDAITNRQEKGLDVSAAINALEIARRSLDEARVLVEAVNTAIIDNINSTEGSSKEAIKEAINKAVDSIKNARSKYEDVIKVMPKISTETTASTTNE